MNGKIHNVLLRSKTVILRYEGRSLRTAGVNLDPLILSEAAIKNIKIYKSHLEWRTVDHVFASEPYEFRVSDAVCQNCNSLK